MHLTMYICLYTHTHNTHTHVNDTELHIPQRVLHWPQSSSHSHSPTNITTFTDCLAIDLLISKSVLILALRFSRFPPRP